MVHVGVGFTTILSADANMRRMTTPEPPEPPAKPRIHVLELLLENHPVGHAKQNPELFW
jgi:hypothetical protein